MSALAKATSLHKFIIALFSLTSAIGATYGPEMYIHVKSQAGHGVTFNVKGDNGGPVGDFMQFRAAPGMHWQRRGENGADGLDADGYYPAGPVNFTANVGGSFGHRDCGLLRSTEIIFPGWSDFKFSPNTPSYLNHCFAEGDPVWLVCGEPDKKAICEEWSTGPRPSKTP